MSQRAIPAWWTYPATSLGENVAKEHAARLLLSGYDIESAAMLSGLPIDQVRAIAARTDLDELTRTPAP